jgi:uncharacterized protein
MLVRVMDVSPLLKIALVFVGLLALNRIRVHLGIALILGGLTLCAWAGRALPEVGGDLLHALSRPGLWLLLLITALIFEYGRYLARTDRATLLMRAASHLGGRHGRALGLISIPSVIGLVPMPGGALFSAPLVDQISAGPPLPPAWKATVNYWFRHTWEYWWPLFPVVIVTLSIFPMETWQFILLQIPLSAATFLGGYLVLIRPHLNALQQEPDTNEPGPAATDLRRLLAPLLIVILCTLLLPPLIALAAPTASGQTRKLLAMLTGLLLGLYPIFRANGAGAFTEFRTALLDRKTGSTILTVAGVILFNTLLDRSQLLPAAADDLLAGGIPLISLVLLLPFIAGLVTGIAIGFAGLSFPLLAGLVAAPDSGLAPYSTLVLGFACGYAGMMLSPIHLCFVLSREFFRASYRTMIPDLIRCSLIPLATAGLLYAALHSLGW